MASGPDPLVLLAALVLFPIGCALSVLGIALLRPAAREVVTSVLAVLAVCFVPVLLFG